MASYLIKHTDNFTFTLPFCTLKSQNISLFLQFNFVGKLLGPKGNSMKRLQEDTMTKMAVLGRGSMKDKQKVRILVRYLGHE
jgi:hypothetical protein